MADFSILDPPKPIAAPQAKKPEAPKLRDIGDTAALRKSTYDRALEAVQSWKPLEYAGHRLELVEPHYDGPEEHSIADQKKAILERGTLGRRLKGTWRLSDTNTGQVLDEKKTTLANIPSFTQRGTIIDNGLEYGISHQSRLRPGVFFRRRENGEIESHVNAKPGQGPSHRYFLDPEKNVFYTRVGQAKIPLAPLFHAMGMNHRDMEKAWGPEIATANAIEDSPHLLRKYHERFLNSRDRQLPETDQTRRLIEKLGSLELDPEVTSRTMSQPFGSIDRHALVDITKKLLAISRGEADVDNRDDLAYQTIMGPDDIIAERLGKDYGGFRKKLLWKAVRDRSLRSATPGYLNQQVRSALLQSGLGQSLEETNTAELLDKQFRITRLGEGGLPDDAIPDSARSVHDSQLNFIDPIRTPEAETAGVDLFLSRNVKKGSDGKIYAPFKDPRTGETSYFSPQDVARRTVALPGELQRPGKRAYAVQGGRLRSVRKRDVDLAVSHMEDAFSPLGNLVPLKSSMHGQRMAMASRMLSQSLPLVGGESPHVTGGVPDGSGRSFEEHYGEKFGAMHAQKPARVMAADNDHVRLRYADGTEQKLELHNAFPFNRKTYYHQEPVVQPGQVVKPGDLLTKSNYTDDKGRMALGLNARVAYVPDEGWNFEDAMSVSEDFAKRLASDHLYPHRFEPTDEHKVGRGSYLSLFPDKFSRRQLDTIGEDGVVKPGTTLQYGDPLLLAAKASSTAMSRVHRQGGRSFGDAAMKWEHHDPGVVTDAVNTPKGISVFVRSLRPTQVADKLSGRHGNKGVIARIIKDDEMLHDSQGKPFDVLLNPNGIISRRNPSAVSETMLGKISEKTGKKYTFEDFGDVKDVVGFAKQELAKHGLTDLEDIVDPRTGKRIKKVLTGNQYIMKLHHLSEDKFQGRGTGGYSMLDQPTKGKIGQAKRLSLQETNSLLSHGALSTLRDASQIRGQRNEDFWLSFMQGYQPPAPQVPLVYKKFVADLQASGINVVSDGTQQHIMALTDKDIKHLAADREVKSGELVDSARSFKPIAGGLFDPKIFGDDGKRWGFISLPEPIVNPVMEDPVRRTLGLTKRQLEEVISSKAELPTYGGTGPHAIQKALASINLPAEIARTRSEINRRRGAGRDDAVKRLGFLLGAEKNNLHPGDWMLNQVPVLPPAFRQVGLLGNTKIPLVPDPNFLYRELLSARDNLTALKSQVSDVGQERLALYNSYKAVTGLGDPLSKKLVDKNVQGILGRLFGNSPKMSTVQRRLLSQTVDLVGRAVVSSGPGSRHG
jgi:DNA-directed RNA polymerase beta subunit